MKLMIQHLLTQSLEEYQNTWHKKIKCPITTETTLYGENGIFDSFGLVNWILMIEEKLNQQFNRSITLTSEKVFSQRNSPFQSVTHFAQYIVTLLDEESEKNRNTLPIENAYV